MKKWKSVLGGYRIVDLTHELHSGIPTWSGSCGWSESIKMDYPEGLRVNSYRCQAGVGTHLDAPSHFIEGGWNVADIPLEQLIVPACVLHLTEEMDPDLLIGPAHLKRYEEQHGPIPAGCLVIAHTGWSRFWNEPARYRNANEAGHMRFPSYSPEAADFLVARDVAGIGIDTLSPEAVEEGFPVHHKVLGAGKYIIENLANLDRVPASGAFVIAFPQKVRHGTESSIRAAALIPE